MSGGLAGTVAPSSAQKLVRSRRSKASGTSTMPKGAVVKTSMVPRVSMISMVAWYQRCWKGCWTRWTIVVGLCFSFSLRRALKKPPKRHGVEDVGGVAGIDDADVVAGVNYAGKGTRRRPWCSLSSLEPSFPVVMGSNCCSPLNGKPLAMVESSGQVDDAAHVEGAR